MPSNDNNHAPPLSLDVENLAGDQAQQASPDANHLDSEAPPSIDFYSDTVLRVDPSRRRPTINELAEGKAVRAVKKLSFHPGAASTSHGARKFGWIEGVFIRCIQNIFGVILFLRLTWVTAQAGILLGLLIIALSTVLTTITAISTSAIATNGEMKGGGLYFLISRTLGPEFGGSIGLIFSIANCVGGALYIVGFAETVRDQLLSFDISIIDGGSNDVRLIACVSCIVLMSIIAISNRFESKVQQFMMIPLLLSLACYYLGTFWKTDSKEKIGFTGYSGQTLYSNMLPSFRDGNSFFTVFAVYFPAATGIMAGANISGDLKKPQKAIPRGTLWAIVVTTVIYMSILIIGGATVVRDAEGTLPLVADPVCATNMTCPYGLANYYQVVASSSLWPPIMVFGIFSSTLSSALASLISAPKIFQAVCKDNLIPFIGYFGKGFGPSNEPRRAYLLTLIIATSVVLIGGELNIIAPVISNFFLGSYALINYSCFNASFSQTPGFRPGFAYYNMWVSLAGSVFCLVIMFIVSWYTALITFFFFAVIYMFIKRIKPDVNWGASLDANVYKSTLQGIQKLTKNAEHVKNYRPQVLVMSGEPWERASLVLMGSSITRSTSLLLCGNVLLTEDGDFDQLKTAKVTDISSQNMLRHVGVKAICKSVVASSLEAGCVMFCQSCGLGKLAPNIILFGFLENESRERQKVNTGSKKAYLEMITSAFKIGMGVAIYRSRQKVVLERYVNVDKRTVSGESGRMFNVNRKRVSEIPSSMWHRPYCKGRIDVWWLSDDGGLTLLIPYLLTLPKSHLEGSRLRVFTVASGGNLAEDSAKMTELLRRFRIPYRDLHVLSIDTKPKKETLEDFNEIIAPFRGEDAGQLTGKELANFQSQTHRKLVTRELLMEYSSDADLIVITLPFPPSGISGLLYTSWLEIMTMGLPSTLFVRGNQQSVLTFYS